MSDSRTRDKGEYSTGLWWVILTLGCAISVFLNTWHALTLKAEGTSSVLGVIFALVPVVFAALLSHGLVLPIVTWQVRFVILGLFGLAMATSIVSQATVLLPYGGGFGGEWTIPVVLDSSGMLALNFIMKITQLRRKAEDEADEAADMAAIRADIEADIRPDIEADIRRTFEADMPRIRADIRTDMQRTFEADMASRAADIRADIETATEADMVVRLAELEEDLRQRIEVETTARLRLEMAGKSKTAGKAAPRRAAEPQSTASRLSSEERMRMLLVEHPDWTVAELAAATGITARQVRRIRGQITAKSSPETGVSGADNPADVRPLRVV
jgi:hypothetical protein